MSIPDRIYRLGKAYANSAKERIEDALAERELDASLSGGRLDRESEADALLRRAQEKINASRAQARGELDPASTVTTSPVSSSAGTASSVASGTWSQDERAAFQTLGIPPTEDLSKVQATYQQLAGRADSRRFPDGSMEQQAAAQILERINSAYDTVRRKLDPTENRFGKLEL
ncbi:MAG: hypothetical protein ACOVP2_00700 [Armatimonadaceae bacterium]